MNVDQARRTIEQAGYGMAYPPRHILRAGFVLLHEVDRLTAQLDSVRLELAATVANIAAWDDVLADVIPDLKQAMTYEQIEALPPVQATEDEVGAFLAAIRGED